MLGESPQRKRVKTSVESKNSVYASFVPLGSATCNIDVIWRAVYSYSVSRFGADYKPQSLALEQKIKQQSVFLGVV